MRNANRTLWVFLFVLFGLGCVRDEDFIMLQDDVTILENRLQKMESGTIKKTRTELSSVAQSQRNQTGTLEQILTRTSNIERDLAALNRQWASISERLDRLEVSQLKDKQAFRAEIGEISKSYKDTLTSELAKLRRDFNQAQTELNKAWEGRMSRYTKDVEARVTKLDNEITNFYKELEKTIQSYSSGTYVVQPNDTLSKIAGELGVSIDDLARVNNIDDPGRIRVGQELVIP